MQMQGNSSLASRQLDNVRGGQRYVYERQGVFCRTTNIVQLKTEEVWGGLGLEVIGSLCLYKLCRDMGLISSICSVPKKCGLP